jgi:hypothetical protein
MKFCAAVAVVLWALTVAKPALAENELLPGRAFVEPRNFVCSKSEGIGEIEKLQGPTVGPADKGISARQVRLSCKRRLDFGNHNFRPEGRSG